MLGPDCRLDGRDRRKADRPRSEIARWPPGGRVSEGDRAGTAVASRALRSGPRRRVRLCRAERRAAAPVELSPDLGQSQDRHKRACTALSRPETNPETQWRPDRGQPAGASGAGRAPKHTGGMICLHAARERDEAIAPGMGRVLREARKRRNGTSRSDATGTRAQPGVVKIIRKAMIMPLTWARTVGAGEGNRTLMTSLEDR